MQKPSMGRIVLYQGCKGDVSPAIIQEVHSDTCVNLTVFEGSVTPYRTSVPLVENGPPEDPFPVTSACYWPPRV